MLERTESVQEYQFEIHSTEHTKSLSRINPTKIQNAVYPCKSKMPISM